MFIKLQRGGFGEDDVGFTPIHALSHSNPLQGEVSQVEARGGSVHGYLEDHNMLMVIKIPFDDSPNSSPKLLSLLVVLPFFVFGSSGMF